jgi:AhpD family alkylhydroperoxidase
MTTTLHNTATVDRVKIYQVSPELYDAMMTLSTAAARDIGATLGELIKIRASHISYCAFCLDTHVNDARRLGETEQRLALVAD